MIIKHIHSLRKWFSFLRQSVYERRQSINPVKLITANKKRWLEAIGIEAFDGHILTDKKINLCYEWGTDIGNQLYANGMFEKQEIDFLKSILRTKSSAVILDVGANIGLHSIELALLNKHHRIFSFEPSPKNIKILNENIRLNKVSQQVSVIDMAVSDKAGDAVFYETTDNAYNSLKDTKRKGIARTYQVKVTTIDDFCQSSAVNEIDLIKIDVEGFEQEVLKGANNTLTTLKPDLFVEIYKGTNSNLHPETTIDFLRNLNYSIYVVDEGNLKPFVEHNDRIYNYFFTTKR